MVKLSANDIKLQINQMYTEILETGNKNPEYYKSKYPELHNTSSWLCKLILLDNFDTKQNQEQEQKYNLLMKTLDLFERYENNELTQDEVMEAAQQLFSEDLEKQF